MVKELNDEQGAGYKDPHRTTGSQKEQPSVKLKNGVLHVTGYQKYTVADGLVNIKSKAEKYKKVLEWLDELRPAKQEQTE